MRPRGFVSFVASLRERPVYFFLYRLAARRRRCFTPLPLRRHTTRLAIAAAADRYAAGHAVDCRCFALARTPCVSAHTRLRCRQLISAPDERRSSRLDTRSRGAGFHGRYAKYPASSSRFADEASASFQELPREGRPRQLARGRAHAAAGSLPTCRARSRPRGLDFTAQMAYGLGAILNEESGRFATRYGKGRSASLAALKPARPRRIFACIL